MEHGSFPSLLRQGRIRWELDELTAAAVFGLNVASYDDLEAHDDEWLMVTPAIIIANIVNFLGVDWRSCHQWPEGEAVDQDVPLDELCRGLREKLGLNREDFADRVGFHATFCDVIEGNPMGLSLWPVEVTVSLAQAAGVDALGLAEAVLQPPRPRDRAPSPPFAKTLVSQHE